MRKRTSIHLIGLALLWCMSSLGCTERTPPPDDNQGKIVVFKHGKISADPLLFKAILDRFEALNPGITVKDETLPASTDEQHQFYAIHLEAEGSDFDVLSMDVIWVPEFARAGWVRDLSHLLPEEERAEFFPGPIEAVTHEGRLYAVPWYIDAGLLYYRKDLLERHGLPPPQTWHQLVASAHHVTAREKNLYGYLWQGKQYEGLVCNVLEYFWSNGGDVLRAGRLVVDCQENVEAISFMRDLVGVQRITPPLVTTAVEETTRHLFGNGKALFMRNWPYAWNIFEREGSPLRGKVGMAPLPAFPGMESASTLGGWQLGINRYSRRLEAAERLVSFLTSAEVQKTLALTIGYKPTRKTLYQDPELIGRLPFIGSLHDIFMKARPRPVSPYYMMMTQVMQAEFSSILSGIKTPEAGLGSAQRQIEHILGAER